MLGTQVHLTFLTGTPVLLIQETMKHVTVEGIIASSPHPILPTAQGGDRLSYHPRNSETTPGQRTGY
jgi:hypothetical protein